MLGWRYILQYSIGKTFLVVSFGETYNWEVLIIMVLVYKYSLSNICAVIEQYPLCMSIQNLILEHVCTS